MLRTLVLVPAILVSLVHQSAAQSPAPGCSQLFTGDACQKSVDLFQYMAPQLGTLIAGGNPVLGQGSVLIFIGGSRPYPGVSLGVRANILSASIPDLTNVPFSITGPSNAVAIPVADRLVVGPTIEAAAGVFRGFPLPTIDVLSVDVILSALYLPEIEEEGVHVDPAGSSFGLGWGARLGILQETILTPSLTATLLRRRLPTVDVVASSQGTNDVDININHLRKTTDSWRVILGKSFVGFALAFGGGSDRYEAGSDITAVINGNTVGPFAVAQEVRRAIYFADLTINVGRFRFAGELGRVSGGNIPTYNVFAGPPPDAARTFGSLGARMTF